MTFLSVFIISIMPHSLWIMSQIKNKKRKMKFHHQLKINKKKINKLNDHQKVNKFIKPKDKSFP